MLETVGPVDVNDLLLFSGIAHYGGVSAAARALGLSKSHVSKRLVRLERSLGVRLVERSTHSFRVTDVGVSIQAQCAAIQSGLQASVALAAEVHSDPRGVVRVSCPHGLANDLVARTLPGFMLRHPEIAVRIEVLNRRVDLIEEQIDVAFRVRERLDTDASLIMRKLGQNHRIIVASPRLAAGGGTDDLDGLAGLPTLAMGGAPEESSWRLTDAEGRERTVPIAPRLVCSDFAVLREAAVAGLGATLLPEDVVAEDLRERRLVRLAPAWRSHDGVVHMVFTSRRGLLPATRAFIDYFAENAWCSGRPETPDAKTP